MKEDGFIDNSAMMQPAIYALLHRGVVVYIGQSILPLARVAAHKTHRKPKETLVHRTKILPIIFDSVWIRPCVEADLDQVERTLIRKYNPKYNVKHNADNIRAEAAIQFRKAIADIAKPDPIQRRL